MNSLPNRSAVSRDNRESGQIESGADRVNFLYRDNFTILTVRKRTALR